MSKGLEGLRHKGHSGGETLEHWPKFPTEFGNLNGKFDKLCILSENIGLITYMVTINEISVTIEIWESYLSIWRNFRLYQIFYSLNTSQAIHIWNIVINPNVQVSLEFSKYLTKGS